MHPVIILIAFGTFLATLIGGSIAIRFRDHLHLVLGFAAGAVAGVALFDLLPESISLGIPYHAPSTIAGIIAIGFFTYLILDRLILLHAHNHDEHEGNTAQGSMGALTLSVHSLLDGIAIGIGFQASVAIGILIAVAVLTHDFSDGINTVSIVLRNRGTKKRALLWLFVDAITPVIGAAATLFFDIPQTVIGLVLAFFVGTFLFLSASDLIPESYHRHPRIATTLMTVLGALVLFIVVHLAG